MQLRRFFLAGAVAVPRGSHVQPSKPYLIHLSIAIAIHLHSRRIGPIDAALEALASASGLWQRLLCSPGAVHMSSHLYTFPFILSTRHDSYPQASQAQLENGNIFTGQPFLKRGRLHIRGLTRSPWIDEQTPWHLCPWFDTTLWRHSPSGPFAIRFRQCQHRRWSSLRSHMHDDLHYQQPTSLFLRRYSIGEV